MDHLGLGSQNIAYHGTVRNHEGHLGGSGNEPREHFLRQDLDVGSVCTGATGTGSISDG